MWELWDIPYTQDDASNPQLHYDLYNPRDRTWQPGGPDRRGRSGNSTIVECPIIVFVHGGGWRTGDKSDHRPMARRVAHATSLPVCCPNYRLSPAVKHPTHTNDIHAALDHLVSREHHIFESSHHASVADGVANESETVSVKFTSLYLIGHSAGAHILGSLFLSPPPSASNPPPPSSSPCYACLAPSLPRRRPPSPPLTRLVNGIICLAGIYSLDLLLRSFPLDFYRSMLTEAFGEGDSYVDVDLTTYVRLPPLKSTLETKDFECDGKKKDEVVERDKIRWAVVHSKGDTLVDMLQPEAFYRHLAELYPTEGGGSVTKGNGDGSMLLDVTTLTGEHDPLLETEEWAGLVKDFILNDGH